jgi:predicted dehydrogenase
MTASFQNESQILKIGLVGCGRAVEKIYLPAIEKLPGIKVIAAVDPIEERRNLVSQKFTECIPYEFINEKLIDQINVGIITTPPDTHVKLALEFLKKNKYILVEKPLALSMDGIKELKEIESSSKAYLMMGFNHRYWLPVVKLKEKLSGNIRIEYAEINFSSDYKKWNPVSFISDPLDDLGPHVFDLINFIFNKEIISVSASRFSENKFNLVVRISDDVYIHCYIAHDNETLRTIRVASSWEKFFVSIKSIRIFPDTGFLRNILDINDRIKTRLLRKTFPIIISYQVQLRRFLEFARSGKAAYPGTADGISAVFAVEAARISINNKGKEIFLNEIGS